ncbi:MAG: hypothetical protein ILN61_10635, partial [Lachnospiraceae bacterium]|nr:hypothetical protein [Lachnospiraceae bacterium]
FTVSAASAGTYMANFTPNSYTITATAVPAEGGVVTVGSNRGNRDDTPPHRRGNKEYRTHQ